MANDDRDLGIRLNHQLQMAESPSSTWRLGTELARSVRGGILTAFTSSPAKISSNTRVSPAQHQWPSLETPQGIAAAKRIEIISGCCKHRPVRRNDS
jgi:hypothetical protein